MDPRRRTPSVCDTNGRGYTMCTSLWTTSGWPVDWDKNTIRALSVKIGTRVRHARKDRALSQDQLAEAVGLTRASVANIEAGRQRPPIHILISLAETFGLSVTDLLPSKAELDMLAKVQSPRVDLDGQPDSTHDFVTTALRRATGGEDR